MLYSYFINYNITGCVFVNETKIIIYTNTKILTNAHLIKAAEEIMTRQKSCLFLFFNYKGIVCEVILYV